MVFTVFEMNTTVLIIDTELKVINVSLINWMIQKIFVI